MAEKKFTKFFKKHLSEKLNELFEEYDYPLQACPEFSVPSYYGRNGIDIGIYSEKDNNCIVGIEIEYKSSPYQIKLNQSKFKNWVKNSAYRAGGLFHIIHSEANISQEKMYELIVDGYGAVSEGKDFYYEFYALKDIDRRATLKTAAYLLQDEWEFDARLFALIYQVFGV
ncbi:MAG: hypothetical protein KAV45_08290 [Calditrichia bacterium]|nr:hypothetical protein [Calditrichia bacterium]